MAILKNGKVFKAYLGFVLQEIDLNPKIIRYYNLPNKRGLFVVAIEKNSPASRSQVEEGDIIVSFNGRTTNNTHDLFKELTRDKVLQMVDISVIRHAEKLNFGIFPIEHAA